jgi:hypothetical protein
MLQASLGTAYRRPVVLKVLRGRHYVNRAWLRINERLAPLRGYPAFDKLVADT